MDLKIRYPKGRLDKLGVKPGMRVAVIGLEDADFREDDVRAYGPTAGLVDVKVMSFSDTLSGLKLVIPKKDR